MEEIGRRLQERRKELGLSIDDISEITRLTPKHIKALEEGDISFFHDDLAYLRYFIKSYCDACNLDFEDFKDDLRTVIDDYTTTFVKKEQLSREISNKNITKNSNHKKKPAEHTEQIKKKNASKEKKRHPIKFLDPSLLSLIGVVSAIIIVLVVAFFLWNGSRSDAPNPNKDIPIADQDNKKPANDTAPKQEPTKKEFQINKTGVTTYTLDNLEVGETLKIETTFNGSNSGYSVTVDGKDPMQNQVFNMGQTATSEIKVEKDMKISIYVGCMVQVDIKINGEVVKTDDSINPSAWPGSCPTNTLEFTVGEVYEPAQ